MSAVIGCVVATTGTAVTLAMTQAMLVLLCMFAMT